MPMSALDFIFKRRSIRKFTDEKLNQDQIRKLLEAAMAAPSAVNLKPWKFIVVEDVDILSSLRKALPFGKFNAKTAIVVCGDLGMLKKPIVEQFWIQGCSAATENILLAATAMGLGSVWCGVHPIPLVEGAVRRALQIPKGVIPLNVIYLGYPAEEKPARTQYSRNNIFLDRFGDPWQSDQN